MSKDKPNVLYVTSFSADLFWATGQVLLDSFAQQRPEGRMLACYEDDPQQKVQAELRRRWEVDLIDLGQDDFLQRWLTTNADIIPDYLGGTQKECDCPERHERHGRHKHACPGQWMNRTASRFFRKVAAWRIAVGLEGYDYIFWLDSDCAFRKPVSAGLVHTIVGKADVVYMRGRRAATESGILVFNLRRRGKEFVEAICRRYASGEFRKYERWDDGYILTTVIDEGNFRHQDVVDLKRQRGNKVDEVSVWAEYIVHFKGRHSARLNLMK